MLCVACVFWGNAVPERHRRPARKINFQTKRVQLKLCYKVLITKLRSTNSAETHNYKKATKALLVLIPLLGITFCLDMINPSSTGLLVNIYKFSKVVIISTQVRWIVGINTYGSIFWRQTIVQIISRRSHVVIISLDVVTGKVKRLC